jgi:hypothetical protein
MDRLTDRQVQRIVEYRAQMSSIIGVEEFERIRRENLLQDSDADFLLRLAMDMKENTNEWRGFGYLNSLDPDKWERILYKVLKLKPRQWEVKWEKIMIVVKALALNWDWNLAELIPTAMMSDRYEPSLACRLM